MSVNEVLNKAMDLSPQDRYLVIETLVNSLDELDKDIEKLWIEESEKRLKSYENGTLKTVSFEEVFDK